MRLHGCRAWPLAAIAAGLMGTSGCEEIVTEVSVGFLLPEDDAPLRPTNNVSVTLTPDGFSETFSAQGPDFTVEIELEPDDTPRSLSVFMAQGETLLGYGTTPPFSFSAAAGIDLRVFISYPGTLTTYPAAFEVPDESTLAAQAIGRGLVAVGGDGSTLYIDAYTHRRIAAAPLVSDRGLPDPTDGALVSNALGNVDRIVWEQGISGFRFDVLTNTWSDLQLDGAVSAGVRSGAIDLLDPDAQRLHLFGGSDRLDVATIDLSDPAQAVAISPRWSLDVPRPGATATWLQVAERDPEPVLMGSGDATSSPVYFPARAQAFGPPGVWSQGRCVQIDAATVDPIRLLCAGGLRGDEPSGDALILAVAAVGSVEIEERVDLLPAPIEDPLWLSDDRAVYAQGSGRFVRVDRGLLTVEEPPAAVLRARGGRAVSFDTTVTFLVGGVNVDGLPVTMWQVFTPDLR